MNAQDYLVIYDIASDKQRKKLSVFLDGFGLRVQKSAYEMHLTDTQRRKLEKGMSHFCGKDDNIRLYKIPDRTEILNWGVERSCSFENVVVV